VPLEIAHPVWMLGFLVLTCISFSLFGFIIGLSLTMVLLFLGLCLLTVWWMFKTG